MNNQHTRRRFLATLTGSASVLTGGSAGATKALVEDVLDIDLKRSAVVVRDLDRSLRFYRDALGMSVDSEIRGDTAAVASSFPFGLTDGRFHLVILKSTPPATGRIALLKFTEPELPPRERRDTLGVGDTIFVLQANDIAAVVERMTAASIEVYRPLYQSERTLSNGNRYRVQNLTCYDPDGVFVEVSQMDAID